MDKDAEDRLKFKTGIVVPDLSSKGFIRLYGKLIVAKPWEMKSIRSIIHCSLISMIFQHSVSAIHLSNPFTSASRIRITFTSDSSKFVSFNSIVSNKKVSLNWIVTVNQGIDQFEVERSLDGKKFVVAALIFASERDGMDNYYFFEKLKRSKTFYRVRAISKDGSVVYSQVILAGTI